MKKTLVCLLFINALSLASEKKTYDGSVTISNPYCKQSSEVELKPIYQSSTKKPIDSIAQKSLYDTVYKITLDTRDGKISKEQEAGRFIHVINEMNKAKNNGISENCMGTFAYNQSRSYAFMSQHVPLVFSLLKRYNHTVNQTKEKLPSKIADYYNTKLSRMFGIETPEINQTEPFKLKRELKSYPAYAQLTKKLQKLVYMSFDRTLNHLTDCLYKNEKILFSGYSDGSYKNLLNDFYTKAFHLFSKKGSYVAVYEAMLIINNGKKSGDIATETDLGHEILNFDPKTSSISKKIKRKLESQDLIIKIKNRIALFCKLVEQYNNTDSHKKRPTPRQYLCYEQQKNLNLVLQQSHTSFDENDYAFAAFKELISNFITLGNSTNHQEIQLCVNKAYPKYING